MAAETFGDTWRRFHLEHASVDPLLCRQWVLEAYKRACTGRQWGFLRAEGQLVTLASRSVTVGVTQGSTAVTSAAAFTATDNGRQFRTASQGIPFTVTFTDTSNLVLDRTYEGETDAAASATIFDAYATMPADFDSLRTLVNPTVQRPMPWFLSREILDYYDPHRTASDSSARMLIQHRLSSSDRVLYEWWPYPTARTAYPMTYYKRPDVIADTTAFQGVLATRSDELLCYARYRSALYPGTPERKNPAYNPSAARVHKEEWELVLQDLDVLDDTQFLKSMELIDWRWVNQGLPFDSNLLRATDASAWDGPGYLY